MVYPPLLEIMKNLKNCIPQSKDMYDIVFDFSSSPVGGSLRRLHAYATFFSKSELKVKFLLHPKAFSVVKNITNLDFEIIYKNTLSKIFLYTKYLKKYEKFCKWYFSYGMPVAKNIGNKNWLHISNVLPFTNISITISFFHKLKILLQKYYFNKFSINVDIVSAESRFTLEQYQILCGDNIFILMPNGLNPIRKTGKNLINLPSKGVRYAIAVGTASYKRIDKTIMLYREIKHRDSLELIILIGQKSAAVKEDKEYSDIKLFSNLSDEEYFFLLKNAAIFISTSEIENSSCAVLEASLLVETCYLSDIPSHRELIEEGFIIENHSNEILKIKKSASIDALISQHDWDDTIKRMLKIMNFYFE